MKLSTETGLRAECQTRASDRGQRRIERLKGDVAVRWFSYIAMGGGRPKWPGQVAACLDRATLYYVAILPAHFRPMVSRQIAGKRADK